jgi:hypothetical protein
VESGPAGENVPAVEFSLEDRLATGTVAGHPDRLGEEVHIAGISHGERESAFPHAHLFHAPGGCLFWRSKKDRDAEAGPDRNLSRRSGPALLTRRFRSSPGFNENSGGKKTMSRVATRAISP